MQIIPIILVIGGLVAGAAGGHFLKPKAKECAPDDLDCLELAATAKAEAEAEANASSASAFVNLQRQFVVPIVRDRRVQALVVASLAVEVDEGNSEKIFSLEPKLRDAFLQVLFIHAHAGGFDGDFTAAESLRDLKGRLREVGAPVIGDIMRDVLITEIVRQDM